MEVYGPHETKGVPHKLHISQAQGTYTTHKDMYKVCLPVT